MNIVDRFLEYVKIDTTSDENSKSTPSTLSQFELARLLVKQLTEMGVEVELDEKNCIVMATIPSNIENDEDIPTIGFISHMDTSPDSPGKDIKINIVKNYDGESDIVLDEKENVVIRAKDNEVLKKYKGQDIITTDGTTLLGADDKAGIAAIMGAVEFIVKEGDNFKHGKVRIAFTSDEEIGRSADHFDVKKFGCKYAYTVDGSEIGELEFETFNAATVNVEIKGVNVHPGYAKNKMINALNVAHEYHAMMPKLDRPEHTEEREGYFHLMSMKGNVSKLEMTYIIRDHSREVFEYRKNLMIKLGKELNGNISKLGGQLNVTCNDSYYNMGEKIMPVYDPVVTIAIDAMKEIGIESIIRPIRGGTDGARLSFNGLPCPNIFAGGHNFHSKFEYLPIPSLVKAKETVITIIKKYAMEFSKKE